MSDDIVARLRTTVVPSELWWGLVKEAAEIERLERQVLIFLGEIDAKVAALQALYGIAKAA